MSFSFTFTGKPRPALAALSADAAGNKQFPYEFANAIIDQLAALPIDAEVTLVATGHTGWSDTQTSGRISLQVDIDVRVEQLKPVKKIEDKDPEAVPGAERFPETFDGDAPPGPSASDSGPA